MSSIGLWEVRRDRYGEMGQIEQVGLEIWYEVASLAWSEVASWICFLVCRLDPCLYLCAYIVPESSLFLLQIHAVCRARRVLSSKLATANNSRFIPH